MTNPNDEHRGSKFESFYGAHYLDISGYVRRRVDEHQAGDVIGEVFMVAWRAFDRVPPAPEDRLWLFGVARRCVANSHRSGLRRRRLQIRLASQPPQGSPMDSDDGLLYVQIREAIDRCRPVDREALKLVFWEELSHAEAATVLGCSVNAFEIRFRRARQRVRDELAVPNASSKSNEPRSIKTSEARRIYPS